MKVNRLELIDRIRTIIDQRKAAQAERLAADTRKAEQAEAEYVKKYVAAWGKFADTIRLRNRQGRAITHDDVPESLRGYNSPLLFKAGIIRQSDYVAQVDHPENLIAVLESSPDEMISTSTLAQRGIPLKDLIRQ